MIKNIKFCFPDVLVDALREEKTELGGQPNEQLGKKRDHRLVWRGAGVCVAFRLSSEDPHQSDEILAASEALVRNRLHKTVQHYGGCVLRCGIRGARNVPGVAIWCLPSPPDEDGSRADKKALQDLGLRVAKCAARLVTQTPLGSPSNQSNFLPIPLCGAVGLGLGDLQLLVLGGLTEQLLVVGEAFKASLEALSCTTDKKKIAVPKELVLNSSELILMRPENESTLFGYIDVENLLERVNHETQDKPTSVTDQLVLEVPEEEYTQAKEPTSNNGCKDLLGFDCLKKTLPSTVYRLGKLLTAEDLEKFPNWTAERRMLSVLQISVCSATGSNPDQETKQASSDSLFHRLNHLALLIQEKVSEWKGVFHSLDLALLPGFNTNNAALPLGPFKLYATVIFGFPDPYFSNQEGCEDFPLRSCFAALALANSLQQQSEGYRAAIAVGVGKAVCSLGRYESCMLSGPIVRETSRLLLLGQQALGTKSGVVVLCNRRAREQTISRTCFEFSKITIGSTEGEVSAVFCPYTVPEGPPFSLLPSSQFKVVLAKQFEKAAVPNRVLPDSDTFSQSSVSTNSCERLPSFFLSRGAQNAITDVGFSSDENNLRPYSWPKVFSKGMPFNTSAGSSSSPPRPRPNSLGKGAGLGGLATTQKALGSSTRSGPEIGRANARLSMPRLPIRSSSAGMLDSPGTARPPKRMTALPSFCGMRLEVVVWIPSGGLLERVTENSCSMIPSSELLEAKTLLGLLTKVHELTKLKGLLRQDVIGTSAKGFVLNVRGTRFFLPQKDYAIKHLPEFVNAATNTSGISMLDGLTDAPVLQRVDLVYARVSEVLRYQGRIELTRRYLVEEYVCLCDKGMGGVILLEGKSGMGKTFLLDQFHQSIGKTCRVYRVTAAPRCGEVLAKLQGSRAQDCRRCRRLSTHSSKISRPWICCRGGYGPWGSVLSQYLESKLTRPKQQSDEELKLARTSIFLQTFSDCPNIQEHSACLNRLLRLQLPESEASQGTGDSLHFLGVMFHLIVKMASEEPSSVILLDDATHMDIGSWLLAYALAQGYPIAEESFVLGSSQSSLHRSVPLPKSAPAPLLLVLAFRPLLSPDINFEPEGKCPTLPASVQNMLLKLDNRRVRFLKLNGIGPEELQMLVLEALGVTPDVAESFEPIVSYIEERSQGHPWAALELVKALPGVSKNGGPQSITDSPVVSLKSLASSSKQANFLNRVASQIMESLDETNLMFSYNFMCAIGSEIDSLEMEDQLLLKIASLLDDSGFSASLVKEVHPIPSLAGTVEQSISRLVACGVLFCADGVAFQQNQDQPPNTTKEEEEVYAFTFWFHKHVVRYRLLSQQAALLRERIADRLPSNCLPSPVQMDSASVFSERSAAHRIRRPSNADGEEEVSSAALQKDLSSTIEYEGVLEIRKQYTSDRPAKAAHLKERIKNKLKRTLEMDTWKRRHCVLSQQTLSLFKEKTEHHATQIIFLEGASVQVEMSGDPNRLYIFRMCAQKHIKDGKIKNYQRWFVCNAESSEKLGEWVSKIRSAIQIACSARNRGAQVQRPTNFLVEAPTNESDSTIQRIGGLAFRIQVPMSSASDNMRVVPPKDGLRLVLQVQEGRDLPQSPQIATAGSPFCQLSLGTQRKWTREGRPTGPNSISFGCELLCFDLTLSQWLKERLEIKVLSKEPFLTPDHLANTSICLADITPTVANLSNKPGTLDTTCLQLSHPSCAELNVGRLLVCVRLILSTTLSNEAWELGSVDQLRQIAEEKMAEEFQSNLRTTSESASPEERESFEMSHSSSNENSSTVAQKNVQENRSRSTTQTVASLPSEPEEMKLIPAEKLEAIEGMLARLLDELKRVSTDARVEDGSALRNTTEKLEHIHCVFKEMMTNPEEEQLTGPTTAARQLETAPTCDAPNEVTDLRTKGDQENNYLNMANICFQNLDTQQELESSKVEANSLMFNETRSHLRSTSSSSYFHSAESGDSHSQTVSNGSDEKLGVKGFFSFLKP